jgi:hypothetical protein
MICVHSDALLRAAALYLILLPMQVLGWRS